MKCWIVPLQPTLLALRKRSWLKSAKIQSSHSCCFFCWFRSFQQSRLLTISYTLIVDNITKYNEFCAKEEASSVNERTVAQRSYKKARGGGTNLGHDFDGDATLVRKDRDDSENI